MIGPQARALLAAVEVICKAGDSAELTELKSRREKVTNVLQRCCELYALAMALICEA